MQKAFSNFQWQNYPSMDSPINRANLMKINNGLDTVDDRVITLDTTKFNAADAQGLIKSLTFNRTNGVFTITYVNGATATIDTMLEKLAVNFGFDESTQQLVITLDDGTVKRVDLSAFIKPLELIDSDTIDFQLQSNGSVTAIVKEGSIQEKHLQPNYLADIRVEVSKAQSSATNAASSATTAQKQATLAKGYSDNAKSSADTSKEYLTKVEKAGDDAVKEIQNALDVDAPSFVMDLSTGHLMYSGSRFVFNVNNNGHLEWGLAV